MRGSASRDGSGGEIKIFRPDPFHAQVVHPLDENARVGFLHVLNRACDANCIPAKLRIPSRDEIAGRELLGGSGNIAAGPQSVFVEGASAP